MFFFKVVSIGACLRILDILRARINRRAVAIFSHNIQTPSIAHCKLIEIQKNVCYHRPRIKEVEGTLNSLNGDTVVTCSDVTRPNKRDVFSGYFQCVGFSPRFCGTVIDTLNNTPWMITGRNLKKCMQ